MSENVLKILEDKKIRQEKFLKPPKHLLDEYEPDANWKPIVGIITLPTGDSRREIFDFDQYILEVNCDLARWGGARVLAIPYNIDQ